MKKSVIAILLTLLFVMLAIPAFATNSSDMRIIDSDIQLHVIQGGVQEALVTISDNGTIWIDPALSREDIVKVMLEAGWPDNYEFIFGNSTGKEFFTFPIPDTEDKWMSPKEAEEYNNETNEK